MVRLENGMHHATWTQSSPFSSSCTDIMKPRSSCRPRIPLSVWLSKALQTAIRTLYTHRNQSSRWIRKNETSTLDTGIQKYRKNDDLLPAIGTYKVFETRCWKVKWRFQWIEQMLSYTWLAGWHTALVEIVAGMTLASILTLPPNHGLNSNRIQTTKHDKNMLSTRMTSPCLLQT